MNKTDQTLNVNAFVEFAKIKPGALKELARVLSELGSVAHEAALQIQELTTEIRAMQETNDEP